MVQAALYQLVLDRKVGEYELPEGASLIACGNRETDRGVVHRMPTPLASRFVHLDIRVDAEDWMAWGRGERDRGRGAVLHHLRVGSPAPVRSAVEGARVPVSRTWEFTSNIVKHRNGLDRRPSGRCSGARSARPQRSSSRRS